METETSPSDSHFDAFISHSSQNSPFAAQLAQALQANGLKVWIDFADLRFGALLRNELQSAIRTSSVLVLLWSKSASLSRWVMAEMFTAFHLDRFIIPCVLDKTSLPQFLHNAAYLDRRRDKTEIGEKLCRAIRAAPTCANEVPPLISGRSPVLTALEGAVATAQRLALGTLEIRRDFEKAAECNAIVEHMLQGLKERAPLELEVLNLDGYQHKNNYIFKHWAAIHAGRSPRDPLLTRGERCFFEALCVNPLDLSAINGLGSILVYERELDAAEFFIRRAIELTKRTGGDYKEAQHDLDLVLYYKGLSPQPPKGVWEVE
jgi:hypothetical protein